MQTKLAKFQERFKQGKRFQKKCAVSVPVALHLRKEPDMPRAVAAQKAETEETTTAASAQSTAGSDAMASSAEASDSTAAASENSNSGSADAGNAKTGSGSGASSNASGSSASAGGSSSSGGSSSGGSSSAAGSSSGSTGSGGNTSKPTEPVTSAPEPEFAMTADEIIAYASDYIESTYNATYIDEFNKNNCGWNAPSVVVKGETRVVIERRLREAADATYVGTEGNYYKVYVEMVDSDTMKVYLFY